MKHWSFNLSLLKNLTTKGTKAMTELFNFSYFENKSSQKNKNQRFLKTYVFLFAVHYKLK
ncbi:hypothetical protein SAMN05216324_102387 [Chryseobacterium limigenitum]|uniref:Uncharacterized protein n=1 Tax=Chryseobacterium limigenitum TaxID=1612149 RepID=A0A1K2IGE3_9FLAO|nr:hypothetical protein SAMN05216324_102387 [Chryseobacterium limigenitum]